MNPKKPLDRGLLSQMRFAEGEETRGLRINTRIAWDLQVAASKFGARPFMDIFYNLRDIIRREA